jgi:hypothetical protein
VPVWLQAFEKKRVEGKAKVEKMLRAEKEIGERCSEAQYEHFVAQRKRTRRTIA